MDGQVSDWDKHDFDHLEERKKELNLLFVFCEKTYKVRSVDVDFDRYYRVDVHHVEKYFQLVIKIISIEKKNKSIFNKNQFNESNKWKFTSVWTSAGRCVRSSFTVWNTSTTPSYRIRSKTMLNVRNTPVRPAPIEWTHLFEIKKKAMNEFIYQLNNERRWDLLDQNLLLSYVLVQ